MEVHTLITDCPTPSGRIDDLSGQLSSIRSPSLVLGYFNVEASHPDIWSELKNLHPGVPLIAGSSCSGILSNQGFSQSPHTIGLWVLEDPAGQYAVGLGSLDGEGAESAGASAAASALSAQNIDLDQPDLVWVILPPGQEEAVLEGIRSVAGPNTPIFGGSTADNDLSGAWQQVFNGQIYHNAVICIALKPSTALGMNFAGGHEATNIYAEVTAAHGRIIQTLDHEPAAVVYNRWIDGGIDSEVRQKSGRLMSKTTLHPFGRRSPKAEGEFEFLLSHPIAVTQELGLVLCTEVKLGDRLYCMTATKESLTSEGFRVAEHAREQVAGAQLAGALVAYCAGCMMSVSHRDIETLVENFNLRLNAPWIGVLSYGEQGCFANQRSVHGNLMVSAVTVGRS